MVIKMLKKIWRIEKHSNNMEIKGLDNTLIEILRKRGLENRKEIDGFLYGDENNLFSPFLMKDMDIAVKRIAKAIKNKEKVLVFGDYDVDGITSTALIYTYLKKGYDFQVDY